MKCAVLLLFLVIITVGASSSLGEEWTAVGGNINGVIRDVENVHSRVARSPLFVKSVVRGVGRGVRRGLVKGAKRAARGGVKLASRTVRLAARTIVPGGKHG
ncbi:unnamed protein product [Allacma fusca]|uniref:Uncharacterized protein n=1 Tax=Allacma fusca TaxID=39272 RepID=A0A8J2PJ45_9HEXA|nr:unnamed protein product [Allacma fusca]